jgi:hypothetical protein
MGTAGDMAATVMELLLWLALLLWVALSPPLHHVLTIMVVMLVVIMPLLFMVQALLSSSENRLSSRIVRVLGLLNRTSLIGEVLICAITL